MGMAERAHQLAVAGSVADGDHHQHLRRGALPRRVLQELLPVRKRCDRVASKDGLGLSLRAGPMKACHCTDSTGPLLPQGFCTIAAPQETPKRTRP
jgi:hypothetical protein